jgi:histidine triad (HIT) family protein
MTETRDPSCIFCKIAAGDVPAEILHSTDTTVAFRDMKPEAPTHVLLIPKEHVRDLTQVADEHAEVLVDLMTAAAHVADAEGLSERGWRVVANVGPDAGQSVFHLHFHLLGGRRMGWPPG